MVFYLQMAFREEFLVRKGKHYYPQTLEFVSSLPNANLWGEDKHLVVVELSLPTDKFLQVQFFIPKLLCHLYR